MTPLSSHHFSLLPQTLIYHLDNSISMSHLVFQRNNFLLQIIYLFHTIHGRCYQVDLDKSILLVLVFDLGNKELPFRVTNLCSSFFLLLFYHLGHNTTIYHVSWSSLQAYLYNKSQLIAILCDFYRKISSLFLSNFLLKPDILFPLERIICLNEKVRLTM